MVEPKFIHLNVHSEYTVTASTIRLPKLFSQCRKLAYPAVALTDPNSFGSLKFYQQALASGIKPLIGGEIKLILDETITIEVLVKNYTGYLNLLKIFTHYYLKGQKGIPAELLTQHREGLIILSGELYRKVTEAKLEYFKRYFTNNFYLEISRLGLPNEEQFIKSLVNLSQKYQIPLVATNQVYFLEENDYEAHEVKVCITGGHLLSDEHRPTYRASQYLKSVEEMVELFGDLPESLANSVEIAKRCNLSLNLEQIFLPKFSLPAEQKIDLYLTRVAKEGLKQRLTKVPESQHGLYWQRLTYELGIIIQMEFCGYFLIVADFINWSKNQQIPVGPGRGSGAGSLVAYALKITDLDPIKHQLLFERFLNPERISMPDFDIDFCVLGRDRVIEYVMQSYGAEKVAQIITYGTMAAKAVIRDVGRVLGYPYGFVDQIAKLVPFTLGITLEQALKEEDLLRKRYETEEETKILIDYAKKLEGLVRNLGKHAGGLVISPTALTDFTALYEQGEGVVTQLDKDDIEKVGLVKFDFLGLKTLTVIDWTVKAINKGKKEQNLPILDINEIPLDDQATYQLMQSGQTTAIFQLESRIAKEVIKKFKPNCFSDMIALVAIIRPGVLQSGMLTEILERKAGRAAITYFHPKLKSILQETYGVTIYQEQVMQIAQVLAGYSLGEADLLRRAMGKKKRQEMEKHRTIFTERAVAKGVDRWLADEIFNYMVKFASYGFNKSHSVAYGLIAYQTAWLKKHFPAEFMAAFFSSEMSNTDKLVINLIELKNLGIKVLPPDLQNSEFYFKALDSKTILYGLGAIKGVGEGAVEALLKIRPEKGFIDLADFIKKMDWQKANKRFLEALINAGALDNFGIERAILYNNLEYLVNYTGNHGQLTLWEEEGDLALAPVAPWTSMERLTREREVLGTYFSGHPIEPFLKELAKFTELNWLKIKSKSRIRVAGFLKSLKITTTKNGKKMALLILETQQNNLDTVLFTEVFRENRAKLVKNQLLVLQGEISMEGDNWRFRGEEVYTWIEARNRWAKTLKLTIKHLSKIRDSLMTFLQQLPRGNLKILCQFIEDTGVTSILLEKKYQLSELGLAKLNELGINYEFFY